MTVHRIRSELILPGVIKAWGPDPPTRAALTIRMSNLRKMAAMMETDIADSTNGQITPTASPRKGGVSPGKRTVGGVKREAPDPQAVSPRPKRQAALKAQKYREESGNDESDRDDAKSDAASEDEYVPQDDEEIKAETRDEKVDTPEIEAQEVEEQDAELELAG
jgi:hypothetical protein